MNWARHLDWRAVDSRHCCCCAIPSAETEERADQPDSGAFWTPQGAAALLAAGVTFLRVPARSLHPSAILHRLEVALGRRGRSRGATPELLENHPTWLTSSRADGRFRAEGHASSGEEPHEDPCTPLMITPVPKALLCTRRTAPCCRDSRHACEGGRRAVLGCGAAPRRGLSVWTWPPSCLAPRHHAG